MKRNTTPSDNHLFDVFSNEIAIPSAHKEQLRLYLTQRAAIPHETPYPPRSTSVFKERYMIHRFKIMGGGLAALALLISTLSFSIQRSPNAAAASVDRAKQAVSQLSEAEFATLTGRLNKDPKTILESARAAGDLKEVSCTVGSDLPTGYSASDMQSAHEGSGSETIQQGLNKCYSYTDGHGAKNVVGLDANSLPVSLTITQ